MKKKNILIMVLAIMLFGYVTFKVTLLFVTNKHVRTTIYNYQVKDSIVLEYSEPKVKLTFKNITMRDDFERFNNFETENGTMYTLKKDDYKATFFITIEDDFVSNSNKTLSKFYKKYKINNTLDLINYLYKFIILLVIRGISFKVFLLLVYLTVYFRKRLTNKNTNNIF